MPTETAALTPESIVKKYEEYKVSQCSASRAAMTRASDLGHPCLAYIAFTRIAGEQASLPDATLASIFAEGRLQEEGVKADLMKMGFRIEQSQRSIYWSSLEISGHIDGFLVADGMKPMLIEIKSCSPFAFAKLKTIEDIKNAKEYYYQKWLAQLMVYMLLESVEESYLLLKSKSTGQIRIIPVALDYSYAEQFIKKAEEVKAGVAWDRRGHEEGWQDWLIRHRLNDPEICNDCPFKAICLPEINAGPGAAMFNDPEIEEALNRRAELEPMAKEYKELDEDIKERAKPFYESGQEQVVCGNWFIQGKKSQRKAYTVKESDFWTTKISRIEK